MLVVFAAAPGWAQSPEPPRLQIDVEDGRVSVAAHGAEFSERELAAIRARVKAQVKDSPLHDSGALRVALRGAPVQELQAQLRAIDLDDPRAVERVTDRFLEAHLEPRSDQPLTEPVEVVIGRGFRFAAGQTPGSVVAIGSSGVIEGSVADLIAIGSDVRLAAQASVDQRLLSVGSRLALDPGARVAAQELRVSLPAAQFWRNGGSWGGWRSPEFGWRAGLGGSLFGLALSFGLGMLYVRLAPRFHGQVLGRLAMRPWPALGVGFLHYLAIVPGAVLLVLTVIGIIFLPMYLMAIGLLIWIAYVTAAAWIGRTVARTWRGWQQLLVGLVILTAVAWIPVIGGFADFIAITFAVGAVMQTVYERLRARRGRGRPSPVTAPEPAPPPPAGAAPQPG